MDPAGGTDDDAPVARTICALEAAVDRNQRDIRALERQNDIQSYYMLGLTCALVAICILVLVEIAWIYHVQTKSDYTSEFAELLWVVKQVEAALAEPLRRYNQEVAIANKFDQIIRENLQQFIPK